MYIRAYAPVLVAFFSLMPCLVVGPGLARAADCAPSWTITTVEQIDAPDCLEAVGLTLDHDLTLSSALFLTNRCDAEVTIQCDGKCGAPLVCPAGENCQYMYRGNGWLQTLTVSFDAEMEPQTGMVVARSEYIYDANVCRGCLCSVSSRSNTSPGDVWFLLPLGLLLGVAVRRRHCSRV